mgnify:CR=1 FL=1
MQPQESGRSSASVGSLALAVAVLVMFGALLLYSLSKLPQGIYNASQAVWPSLTSTLTYNASDPLQAEMGSSASAFYSIGSTVLGWMSNQYVVALLILVGILVIALEVTQGNH